MMKKVSFDFDSTLDRVDVQIFAKSLVDKGFEVWIVTSRPDIFVGGDGTRVQPENKDLYDVAKLVGIKPEHIHFTCYELKSTFIEGKGFLFHLDDDDVELRDITIINDPCEPIHVDIPTWETKCKNLIEGYENTEE